MKIEDLERELDPYYDPAIRRRMARTKVITRGIFTMEMVVVPGTCPLKRTQPGK